MKRDKIFKKLAERMKLTKSAKKRLSQESEEERYFERSINEDSLSRIADAMNFDFSELEDFLVNGGFFKKKEIERDGEVDFTLSLSGKGEGGMLLNSDEAKEALKEKAESNIPKGEEVIYFLTEKGRDTLENYI